MAQIKLHAGNLVRIPAELARKYKLTEGEVIDVHDFRLGIVLIPKKVKRTMQLKKRLDQLAWDLLMEVWAHEEARAGRVTRPFKTLAEFKKYLRKQLKEGYIAARDESQDW